MNLLKMINFYPPYLGAGVKVIRSTADMRTVEVEMKLRFWNVNYVGSHFGGSLYYMVDPFFMLMLMANLGKTFTVWDKSASIKFKKPGKGRVHAKFVITEHDLTSIREEVAQNGKAEPKFTVQILNEQNEVVAEVEKTISVRRKNESKSPQKDSKLLKFLLPKL